MNNMKLYEKLFKVQGLAVKKDASNPFFKSKYMTLDNIISVLSPILEENKMLVFHKTTNKEVVTVLQDVESDDRIESSIPLPENADPQKLGSAITYFKRYNLGQLFNIVTDEDDDGNSSSGVSSQQATQMANDFNKKPVKWINEADLEAMKSKWHAGDNPVNIIKTIRGKNFGVSKKMAELITDYVNQL